MQAVDQPLEPIFCGGNNRTLQEREQWASACNFFAARPGVVIAYERNEATVCELEHGGVTVAGAAPLLSGDAGGKGGGRGAITIDGGEVVRRGGAARWRTPPPPRPEGSNGPRRA